MKLRLFGLILFSVLSYQSFGSTVSPQQAGAEQVDQYLPLLKDKRVGLVVNQTSRAQDQHLVDLLVHYQINVKTIFAVEHGFRGDRDAGEIINSKLDPITGIAIHSIYGKSKKPSREIMSDLDVVIFDIQDVGARFYTFINSMFYMMQAAAEHEVEFIVLDRPNPNIQFVDGPMLDLKFQSFVGLLPIPLLHGMTVGELAQMIVGENWLNRIDSENNKSRKLNLTVIPVKQYYRTDKYDLPIAPSPNLPNSKAIALYPSLCLFEATPVSIGRGTDYPFQVVGFTYREFGDFNFTPRSIRGAASNPKLKGVNLFGTDLRSSKISGFDLSLLLSWFTLFQSQNEAFFERPDFFDKLAGTDQLRIAMTQGLSIEKIRLSWQAGLTKFKRDRAPYLIYLDESPKPE